MRALLLLLLAAPSFAQTVDFDGRAAAALDWRGLLGVGRTLIHKTSLAPSPAAAQIWADGAVFGFPELARRLSPARVVYVGEKHDEAAHHLAQRDVIEALAAGGRRVVVGLEMADKTQQAALDDWQSGAMSDADFSKFWKKAWGFDYSLYAPVLELCRARHIPLRGLNAPISVVAQIAKGGLSSLTPAQRALLPARVDQTANADYLAFVNQSIAGHVQDPVKKAHMLEAMAAWNETMGQSVVDAAAGGATVVIVAGEGHMLYRAGVPESAARRDGSLTQAVVLPYPQDGEAKPLADLLSALSGGDARQADYFWLNAL